MEERKEQTKALISEGLKEIMLTTPFEKITINMIAEKAGIIRPTFYYHFRDKYEVLEWIVESELIAPADRIISQGRYMEGIKTVFENIGKEKQFYRKAFEVNGQNAFAWIITNKVNAYVSAFSKNNMHIADKLPEYVSEETLLRHCAMSFTNVLYLWVADMPDMSVEEITHYFEYTVNNSWSSMLGFDE